MSLLTSLLSVTLQTHAQTARRPQIVAVITVEGLSGDYLRLLSPMFTSGGFNRLYSSGATIDRLYFGPGADGAAASAMIHTGAAPIVNGIPAAKIYDTASRLPRSPFHDAATIGNFTDEPLSPLALKVSTISDELRIDTDGNGCAFAVSPVSYGALTGAGHAGNGAFWLNDMTADWASSAYYKEMPDAVKERNYRTPLSTRLDTMKWIPAFDLTRYPGIPEADIKRPFRNGFPRKEMQRVRHFIQSPLANTEVTDLAIDLIKSCQLGSGKATDFISITYVLPSNASRAEITDSYLRLDRDIDRLLKTLDPDNRSAVMLAGIPETNGFAPDDKRWKIPSGLYSVKRAISLLGIQLMAVHGNGDWITGYHDRNFYLNRQLIKDRGLDLQAFRREVADFLGRMAGVCDVVTIDDIMASRAGDDPAARKRNTSIAHAGDVIIEVSPGWQIVDDGTGRASGVMRHTATDIPAFIIAPGLKRTQVTDITDARALAPTLCRLLRLRAPNGASVPALNL